jgi:hypothetical protein
MIKTIINQNHEYALSITWYHDNLVIRNNIIKWLRHINFLMIFENGEWPNNNNGGAPLTNVQGSLSSKFIR